jgi:hypothetical protein
MIIFDRKNNLLYAAFFLKAKYFSYLFCIYSDSKEKSPPLSYQFTSASSSLIKEKKPKYCYSGFFSVEL